VLVIIIMLTSCYSHSRALV